MKYFGRSKEVAEALLQQFENGDVAAPLKMVLLSNPGLPQGNWSWTNQFITMMMGCTDARGFKQWQKVGRRVASGPRAYIRVPLMNRYKTEDKEGNEETRQYIYACKTVPVWDVAQTSGDDLEEPEDHAALLEALPLMAVAEAWGVKVKAIGVQNKGFLGWYNPTFDEIAIGTENVIVWLHELFHKGDFQNQTKMEPANHWRSETVAQLGACVLAHMLGIGDQADEGMTWQYIKKQVGTDTDKAVTACTQVLNRVCEVAQLIMKTADELAAVDAEVVAV